MFIFKRKCIHFKNYKSGYNKPVFFSGSIPDSISDYCLMPIQQLFSYIMERTSKFLMR